MKRKQYVIVAGVIGLMLLAGTLTAAVAYAQSPTPPTPSTGQASTGGPWVGGGPRHELGPDELAAAAKVLGMTADDLSAQLKSGSTLEQIATAKGVDIQTVINAIRAVHPLRLGTAELDAAAKALGMTSADLSTELQSGKTLADIASAKGVELQTVQSAIQAARTAEMTDQIKAAVASGQMSQDKADWLLEGLSKGYLNGPDGFGFGFGMRGPGMRGGQPQQQLQAPATATP